MITAKSSALKMHCFFQSIARHYVTFCAYRKKPKIRKRENLVLFPFVSLSSRGLFPVGIVYFINQSGLCEFFPGGFFVLFEMLLSVHFCTDTGVRCNFSISDGRIWNPPLRYGIAIVFGGRRNASPTDDLIISP